MMQDKNQTDQTIGAAADSTQAQVQTQDGAVAKLNRAAQGDFVRKIVDKIKGSENILVALSRNPSVDEISAAIGLTLFLEGMQKHTTAIYSGRTPDTLAFLKPEATFETNTDSLQDFIISLGKDKADHLRYKLEGDFVRVYITPYKAKIGEEDLSFSQGDYNVDFVIALNVPSVNELDEALAEHGRIMHDASAVDITRGAPGKFGEIEWSNPMASSVSEMVTELIFRLQGSDKKLDVEVATALLTGIVAATERFSNNRTTPETLSLASKLMQMGADQQLISANVVDNQKLGSSEAPEVKVDDIGMMADFGAPAVGVANAATQVVEAVAPTTPGAAEVSMAEGTNPATQIAEGMTGVAEGVVTADAPITATNQVMPEDVRVQPVVPEAVPANGAVAVDGKKDYAQMLAQALTEPGVFDPVAQVPPAVPEMQAQQMQAAQPVQSVVQPQVVQQPMVQPQMMDVAAGQVGAVDAQLMQQSGVAGQPTAEPVANPYAEVLPPPPAPVAGPDMMPPSLPPVQMPTGV